MHKFGFEMVGIMGSQCINNVAASFQGEEIAHDAGSDLAKARADSYDPMKPENIIPATEEEVERANSILLSKQIAKLEAHAARRRSEPKVVLHYNSVVDTLRSREAMVGSKLRSKLSHRRIRSEPNFAYSDEAFGSSRRRADSDAPAPVIEEEAPLATVEEEFMATPDEDLPAVNIVRACATPVRASVAQMNRDCHVKLGLLSAEVLAAAPADVAGSDVQPAIDRITTKVLVSTGSDEFGVTML